MKLHHVIEGPADAPVVVFVNSLGATLAMWDEQAAALAGAHRVLRYDQRGHGASPVPPGPYTIPELVADLLELLDELGIERAALVGVSLGGAVAMTAALGTPERFERVALCCTAMRFGEPATWHERAAAVRAGGMRAVADAVLERWLTPGAPAPMRERLAAMLHATAPEGYAACCEALAGHDLRGQLGALRLPTLVIAASEDPSTPPELLQAIAAEVPGARLHTIEGSRHIANIEFTDAFDRALFPFLDG